MLWIDDILWTDDRLEHIARHGISRREVEEVAFGDHHATRGRDGTYRLLGRTWTGRFLTIIVSPRSGGLYFVVTAREGTDKERRTFQRR